MDKVTTSAHEIARRNRFPEEREADNELHLFRGALVGRHNIVDGARLSVTRIMRLTYLEANYIDHIPKATSIIYPESRAHITCDSLSGGRTNLEQTGRQPSKSLILRLHQDFGGERGLS